MRRAPERRPWSERTTSSLAFGALGWTLLVGAGLLVAPLATTVSRSASPGTPGAEVTTTSTETLLHNEGAGIVLVLLVPVVIALVGARARGRSTRGLRIGTGAVLAVLCALGAASIGIFYAPAPLLLITAGVRTGPAGRLAPPTGFEPVSPP